MMFATREEFDYLECGSCGTIQLLGVPELAKYYPADYYSLSTGKTYIEGKWQRRFAAPLVGRYLMTGRGVLGKLLLRQAPWFQQMYPAWLRDPVLGLDFQSRILDFGSGTGQLVRDLSYFGFENVTGADAFIAGDMEYANGVRVLKRTLAAIEGAYDLIVLSHTLEHLPDPLDSLKRLARLLAPGGWCLIRIPIASFAWERYGVHWFQLDAPRHLFVFSERAFRDLAAKAGFRVAKTSYDSTAAQFIISEQYARDIPMLDERAYRGDARKSIFTESQITEWETDAESLNAEGRGDQACFYLKLRE